MVYNECLCKAIKKWASIKTLKVLSSCGEKGGKMEMEEHIVRKTMEILPKGLVFDYLLELPKGDVETVILSIKNGSSSQDLRDKVATGFLVKSSIKAAEEHQRSESKRTDGSLQAMLRISAMLMTRSLQSRHGQGFSDLQAVRWCLRILDLSWLNGDEDHLFYTMLRECGAKLDKKSVRLILDSMNKYVADTDKRSMARTLLCTGYIENNCAELAFVALEKEPLSAKVNVVTPRDSIIEALELALVAMDSNDRGSLNKVKALYNQLCGWGYAQLAMQVVVSIRPDLVGVLDEEGSTIGKKAE